MVFPYKRFDESLRSRQQYPRYNPNLPIYGYQRCDYPY